MTKGFYKTVFDRLVEEHGITKMTKVTFVSLYLAVTGASIGYLTSMKMIPDDETIEQNEKESN